MRKVKPSYKGRKNKSTKSKISKTALQPTSLGYFTSIPKEMCFHIFARVPLVDLGNLSLASRSLRDVVLEYIRSKQGLEKILPHVFKTDDKDYYIEEVILLDDALKYSDHFGDLGKLRFYDYFKPIFLSCCSDKLKYYAHK